MKNILTLICFFSLFSFSKSFSEPIRHTYTEESEWTVDNPKGKLKIRFIRNEDKSDTTNRPKGFLAKLKNVVNVLMNVADNPPFKVEIVREKEKKN